MREGSLYKKIFDIKAKFDRAVMGLLGDDLPVGIYTHKYRKGATVKYVFAERLARNNGYIVKEYKGPAFFMKFSTLLEHGIGEDETFNLMRKWSETLEKEGWQKSLSFGAWGDCMHHEIADEMRKKRLPPPVPKTPVPKTGTGAEIPPPAPESS